MTAAPAELTPKEELGVRFSRIFQAEFSYVWGSLRRLGVSPRDAEDTAHDVFLQVFGKLSQFDDTRPIRPWLFGFAYRSASDYRRLARHRIEVMGRDHEAPSTGILADEALCRQDDASLG